VFESLVGTSPSRAVLTVNFVATPSQPQVHVCSPVQHQPVFPQLYCYAWGRAQRHLRACARVRHHRHPPPASGAALTLSRAWAVVQPTSCSRCTVRWRARWRWLARADGALSLAHWTRHRSVAVHTAMKTLRIVIGFGTARRKMVLERRTNPKSLQTIWDRAAI
jgi:hypothetical protein